jgi:hypothetical protein
MKIGKKWLKMAEIYKRFAPEGCDFSDECMQEMYLHESTGTDLKMRKPLNGYEQGKKWMDVTIAMWKEDIKVGQLFVYELTNDGYPDWFLQRIGLLNSTL